MRLRNVKNKEEIINNCNYIILNPKEYISSWQNLFNNNNEIYIEIGMGKGDFIINNALKYPNINFIGIEKYDSVICKAVEKLPETIENLRLIRMDAHSIDEVFNHEISRIYLNFSDPWPKKRHHMRRLTSTLFLEKYDQICKDHYTIYQKTDNQNLFEYSLINFSKQSYQLEEISLDLHKTEGIDNIMTEYETKFVKENKPIYYLKVKKAKKL